MIFIASVLNCSNLLAGILPFGAVFIELFFILSVSDRGTLNYCHVM